MSLDKSIDPTGNQVRELRDSNIQGEVVMLNLLKFKEKATYNPKKTYNFDTDISGKEAYGRYAKGFLKLMASNAKQIYMGESKHIVIGTAEDDWDEVLIVQYESKNVFLEMLRNPEYKTILEHRYAGLEKTRLILTTPSINPKL